VTESDEIWWMFLDVWLTLAVAVYSR